MLWLAHILTVTILVLFYGMPAVSVLATEIHSDMTQGSIRCDDPSDCDAAREAIGRAENFFKSYGYVFNQSVKVEFKKSLSAALKGNVANKQGIHGLYDSETGWCEIFDWQTQSNKKIFGSFDMTKEGHISIITHEAAHRFYHLILSRRDETVSRSLHEFVAYVVQIHTMKEPEKTKVLGLWPGEVFESIENINILVWAFDPNRFAIMAYRFFLNSPKIMQSILDGIIKSDDDKLFQFFHEFNLE